MVKSTSPLLGTPRSHSAPPPVEDNGDEHHLEPAASPAPTQAWRDAEDMLERMPYPVRPLLQTVHIQFSRLSGTGIEADYFLRSLRRMPRHELYQQALWGAEAERLVGLRKLASYLFSAGIEYLVAEWSKQPPDNVVALRAVRDLCDRLLGPQPDAAAADKRARRTLLQVHEDRLARLRPKFTSRLQERVCEDLTLLLTNLRVLMQHPVLGPRIYAPGRTDYGTVSRQNTVLPALLTGAGVTSLFFLPSWAAACVAAIIVLWALYAVDAWGAVARAWRGGSSAPSAASSH